MKKSGFSYTLLLCAFLGLLSHSIVFAQTSCNADDIDSCSWGSWTTGLSSNLVYTVAYCAPCTVTVFFDYRLCTISSGQREQYQVSGFMFDTCSCVKNYLDSLYSASSTLYWQLISGMYLDLNRLLFDQIFINTYNGSGNKSPFYCDESAPSCHNQGNLQNQIISVYSDCMEYVEIGNLTPPIGPSCPGMVMVSHCDGEGCCLLRRSYCWDTNLNAPRVCESWERLSGSGFTQCSGNSSYSPPLGCDVVRRSGCFPSLCNSTQ